MEEAKMTQSLCGADCSQCGLRSTCSGCAETQGRPFGAACTVALCLRDGEKALCQYKKDLMAACNAPAIPDMEEVTQLYALKGSLINLEYPLPGGQSVKFWDDNKIYLGNQLPKGDSSRYYGIVADEAYLMVAEYSGYGSDAEIVVFQRWR